ncbi:MAG: hypothetical protein RL037_2181, partial [Bacteroidota bacterium]
ETQSRCVFVSATERREIDKLRTSILNQVRETYKTGYQSFDYEQ